MKQEPLQLLEEDLIKLFHPHKKKVNFVGTIWNLTRSLIYFMLLYSFFFFSINSPAYLSRLTYFWNNNVSAQNTPDKNSDLTTLKPATQITKKNQAPTMPNGQTVESFLLGNVANNHLVIPKIKVNAPVTWNSPEETVLQDLRKGVAHYQGTSLPGENGNVFISGHSSNYWWDKGLYNHVFTLLDKLDMGDRIYVTYNNKPYVYQIESIKTVKPTDITSLTQPTTR